MMNEPLPFDNEPEPDPKLKALERVVTGLVRTYGYEQVAMVITDHAPIQEIKLHHVDDPGTAKRAGEAKESGDPTRYTDRGAKGRIMLWAGSLPEDAVFDREDAIAWWKAKYAPNAEHGQIEATRRRFDELVEIDHLWEVDTSGNIRTVRLSIAGKRAIQNLRDHRHSKGEDR